MTAVSIVVLALPSFLIVGSVWSLMCDRSKPFRRAGMNAKDQILDTDFASVERWILADERFESTVGEVVREAARKMRGEVL